MPNRYRHYLLALLTGLLAFNALDRVALGIVLQAIKIDLNLTDTQLGLLTGIAFAIFYATMGVPIARWADRGNRVTIISLTAALWSAGVALCATASSFLQLLLIRTGVAVGEAGCIPPAHSLIADYFDRSERPRAVARYMLGVPLALTAGYFSAGFLNELYGWRMTFVILGLPGLALAALARLTLKEPRQLQSARVGQAAQTSQRLQEMEPRPSFREVVRALWSNIAFRHLMICFSVWNFFGYGILQWAPAFFIRSYALHTSELGMWFALIYGVGGGLGVYLGGEWATRFAAGNEPRQLRMCAAAFVVFPLFKAYAFLAPDHYLALLGLAMASLGTIAQGPMLASMQTLVASRMRAMSIALVYLCSNLIGMGLGPLAVGALSDTLQPWLGGESLRYALVALCPGYFWAAWHLWRASATVARDVKTTQVRVENTITSIAAAD
jgi:MFS family permease